jgi:hypothetical protein
MPQGFADAFEFGLVAILPLEKSQVLAQQL